MEFMMFVAGIICTAIFSLLTIYFTGNWEIFCERVRVLLGRGSKRFYVGKFDIEKEIRKHGIQIGGFAFPIKRLIGGDGKIKYTYPGGIICEWNPAPLELPRDLKMAIPRFVEKRKEEAARRGAVFVQRQHVRIDDYEIGLYGLEDDPWPLKLIISITDYYTIQATHASIDEVLPGGLTIREKYAQEPGDLKNSVLANPLAVNLSVVTNDKVIYLAIRGRKAAVNPAGFAPAVSGTGNPHLDRDANGNYDPFLTAQRETEEEVGVRPELSEIVFFGLARTLKFQYPFLFGEVRFRDLTASDLESKFPRDIWETEAVVGIPFDPSSILSFIRKVYAEMEERQIINTGTYAALFSLLMSLLYEYPDEWSQIAKDLAAIRRTGTHKR